MAASGNAAGPATRYVVATRAVGPGERLGAEHLTTVALDLPPAQRRTAFSDPRSVVGRIALGPLGAGELVQATGLGDAPAAGGRELTFGVAPTWAVGGRLVPGDRIDVYATYGDGASSQTLRILSGVIVQRVDGGSSDRLGDAGRQAVTVALAPGTDAAPVVNAVQSAEVTVVRTTGDVDRSTNDPGRPDDRARYDAQDDLDERPDARAEADTPAPRP